MTDHPILFSAPMVRAILAEAGWREIEWFKAGFLTGGMGNTAAAHDDDGPTHQQGRERLWFSPHCIEPAPAAQGSLW